MQGDNRSYRSLAILSGDRLNVDWADLKEVARAIPNHLNFVNRTAYVIDGGENEGELVSVRSRICHESAELLREADDIVTSELMKPMAPGKKTKIAQCFAVLVPVVKGADTGRVSIAVRAVVTNDFMTAQSAVPGVDFPADALSNIVSRIRANELLRNKIDMILYDVTASPRQRWSGSNPRTAKKP